jgi:hypothetical protein
MLKAIKLMADLLGFLLKLSSLKVTIALFKVETASLEQSVLKHCCSFKNRSHSLGPHPNDSIVILQPVTAY